MWSLTAVGKFCQFMRVFMLHSSLGTVRNHRHLLAHGKSACALADKLQNYTLRDQNLLFDHNLPTIICIRECKNAMNFNAGMIFVFFLCQGRCKGRKVMPVFLKMFFLPFVRVPELLQNLRSLCVCRNCASQ